MRARGAPIDSAMTKSPQGKEQVSRALLKAAIKLFAKRGPAQVSIREVAQAAGVNHGLVHRHFGSKAQLVQQAQALLAQKIAKSLGPVRPDETLAELLPGLLEATQKTPQYWRILAFSSLESAGSMKAQLDYPVVERLLAAAARTPQSSLPPGFQSDPQLLVCTLLASGLGLLMFERYLRAATGQSDVDWQKTRKKLLSLGL